MIFPYFLIFMFVLLNNYELKIYMGKPHMERMPHKNYHRISLILRGIQGEDNLGLPYIRENL